MIPEKNNFKFIQSLAEGLMAYLLYLSKCKVSIAYSEYLFYEPFARMLSFKEEFTIHSEFALKKIKKNRKLPKGDFKKIDFVLFGKDPENSENPKYEKQNVMAIEIKYIKIDQDKKLDVKEDVDKLKRFDKEYKKDGRKIEKYIFLIGEYPNEKEIAKKFKLEKYLESSFKAVNNRNYVVRVYTL